MNNNRRNKLQDALKHVEIANDIVDDVKDSEEDSLNNIPENLDSTDRYTKMEDNVEALYNISEDLNDLRDAIQDVIDN